MKTYSNEALRTVALQTIGLNEPRQIIKPTLAEMNDMVNRLGAVQIDTLQMVHRAQYLTLWSRLGNYDTSLFDMLCGDSSDHTLYEGWFHCACYIPLSEYRYEMVRQRAARDNGHHWYSDWSKEEKNRQKMADVLQLIREQGEITTASLEGEKTKFATWWDWRPEKMALEHLWTYGDLMIARRDKFRKVYDLTEKLLPTYVDVTEPTEEVRNRHWIVEGVKRLGVCSPKTAGDYTHMPRGKVHPIVKQLLKDGSLQEIIGLTSTGAETLLIHPENIDLLEKAEGGQLKATRTTFLNPFDNLWWSLGRDELFWGFKQRLEAYTPAAKRIYGYYCLPILHKGKLIGRFDPKLDRKQGILNILSFYLEPGNSLSEQDLAEIAIVFRDFMAFHNAKEIVFHRSSPAGIGKRLMDAIK